MTMKFDDFLDGLSVIDLKQNEIVLFRASFNKYSMEEINEIHNKLQETFPHNTIVIIPDDTSLEFVSESTLTSIIENIKRRK